MTLSIPYSFTPGTKAKAQEVNADFAYVLDQISLGASKDFSDLSEEAEKHFINKNQVTNILLEAPNGVGSYSGSTLTIREGVKVLIPNGRNSDGTLKSIELVLRQNITLNTSEITNANLIPVFLNSNGTLEAHPYLGEYNTATPTAQTNYTYYNKELNYFCFSSDGNNWEQKAMCIIGWIKTNNSGELTSFNPVEVFSILTMHQADGYWGKITQALLQDVSLYNASSTPLYIDLSSIIPNDGCVYEIILVSELYSGTNVNDINHLTISTDIGFCDLGMPKCSVKGIRDVACNTATISLHNKTLTIARSPNYTGTTRIWLRAARKVR